MKKSLISITMLLSATAGAASDDHCTNIAMLAESVMDSHQAGVSISEVLGSAKEAGIEGIIQPMVIEAYDSPRFSTEPMKKKKVGEFRDKWHLRCLKTQ